MYIFIYWKRRNGRIFGNRRGDKLSVNFENQINTFLHAKAEAIHQLQKHLTKHTFTEFKNDKNFFLSISTLLLD